MESEYELRTISVPDQVHLDAHALAERAGRLLLELKDQRSNDGVGRDRELGDRGDKEAHTLLVGQLSRLYPGDGVRSEEGDDIPGNSGRLWIIDPLDGTREYSEPGRTDWAVHVALSVGGVPVVGAVALPAQGLVLSTAQQSAAQQSASQLSASEPPEGEPFEAGPVAAQSSAVQPPTGELAPDGSRPSVGQERPRLVVSRSRPSLAAQLVAAALDAEVIPMGSAGAKIATVITGGADIYVHSGGQYEWDSAAPVAVAVAAGLHASRLDGSPLVYGRPDPWLPDLIVCRHEWATRVLEITATP